MHTADLLNYRLINQQIVGSKFNTVKDIVAWMGAIQAQDFNMVKWAVGVRLPDSTNQLIEAAINNGQILRTHLLRPTWHLVSADDIHWMLDLTASHVKASMRSRDRELELTDAVFQKSNLIFKHALRGGIHLSRESLVAKLEEANIRTNDNRASHLLMRAELDGVICSGRIEKNRQTYMLLTERIPKPKSISHDEALFQLSKRYFTSRSPATLLDFMWWSGLSAKDAKHAFEMVKPDFIAEHINNQIYLFPNVATFPDLKTNQTALLPAFDEFIICYKDRTASLPFVHHRKAVSNNGIFRPIIVINGQVVGIWSRTIKKESVIFETELFIPSTQFIMKQIEVASIQFAGFMNKKVEVIQNKC